MNLDDGTYLCPFCLTSWICEGPHINEEDEENLKEWAYYNKVDHLSIVLEEMQKFAINNNINLEPLASAVKKRLMGRDK